jgi:hypothetical protein
MSQQSKYIKTIDLFQSPPDKKIDEAGLMDFFTGALNVAGDAVQRQIKQKVTAYLLERLGIEEKSKLSRVVQEVVEEIPISDYYEIISGESDAEYWSPKLAKAFKGFILSEGFNTIAESWGINSTGFLYGTIKEALEEFFSNSEYQKEFTAFISTLISPNFGGDEKLSGYKYDSGKQDFKSQIEEYVKGKKPSQQPSKKEAQGLINSFVTGFNSFK